MKMQDLRLRLELLLERLRVFPIAAGLLFGAALGIGLFVQAYLKPSISMEQANLKRQQAMARQQEKKASPAAPDPLVAFSQVLLPKSGQNQFLRSVSQLATQAALKTGHIEFRREPEQSAYQRLTVTIALNASYPRIQNFAFALLAAYPSLALEKIELRRELASLEELQATLHFVLYMEHGA